MATAFPDTLSVMEETTSAGTGGGRIKSGNTYYFEGVPCIAEHIQKFGWRKDQGDKNMSTQMYLVTMPTHELATGNRIELDPAVHRLVIDERGNEPEKTLRIVSIGDVHGVVFEVVASREN